MALLTLRAGPLSLHYAAGEVRYVTIYGRELLRRVYAGVRDQHWNTIPAKLTREEIAGGKDSFRVEFAAEHVADDVDFAWNGLIEGRSDGSVRWEMSGSPRRSFLRNRIGWCVLHPIEGCAGRRCTIEHTDGSTEVLRFPRTIAPHQPFLDIRGMSYEGAPGLTAELQFTGDTFETEDQRNWTDYSFKTYSTPLRLPFPVLAGPADRIEQSVELKLRKSLPVIETNRSGKMRFPRLNQLSADSKKQTHFVELNRDREAVDSVEFLVWAIDPRAHADDELTMIENLQGQRATVEAARIFAPGKPIHILPVRVPPMEAAERWIAISLSELAQAGVESIAYDPVHPVLAEIAAFKPEHAISVQSSEPLKTSALVLESASGTRAWIANFLAEPQAIVFEDQTLTLEGRELRRMELEKQ